MKSAIAALLTVRADGTFDYEPNSAFDALAAGAIAADNFSYTIDDGAGGTASASANFTVTGVVDAPTLLVVGGGAALQADEDADLALPLDAAVVDAGAALSIALSGFPSGGTFSLGFANGADWLITGAEALDLSTLFFTPPENFTNGEKRGEYRISGDQMLEDQLGRSRISRADFAVALVDEAENRAFVSQRFSVAY